MKILVTGVTDIVGRRVLERLQGKGMDVRAGVHSPEEASEIEHEHIDVTFFDFSDQASMQQAVDGVHTVFFATPLSDISPEMAKRAIDIAAQAPINHIVYLSVYGTDIDPGTPMLQAYFAVEEHVRHCGKPYTILRPNTYMEHFIDYTAPTIQRERIIYMPEYDEHVSYIAARDVGDAAAEILSATEPHDARTYFLTGPEALTVREAAAIISEAIGQTVQVRVVDEAAVRQAMASFDAWVIERWLGINYRHRSGNMAQVTDRVEALVGHPPMTFREWAQQNADAFR
jgi:uncharacterized protein YbjT (DUF2867 family)